MVDERIARRRREVRQQRRRHRLHRTVAVVVLLAVAVALLVVERSPLVAISEVRVTGTAALAPEVVRDTAGIRPGTSLLRLGLGEAEARVEALPRVAEASVARVDPLTVEIRVVERIPTMVARRDDAAVLIDDQGVVVARGADDGLIPIVVEHGPLPSPGDSVASSPALANAVAAVLAMPGPLQTRIAGYRAVEDDRVVLELDNQALVEFGRADDVEAKARALAVVLEDLQDRAVTTIDVRAPSAPVVTP